MHESPALAAVAHRAHRVWRGAFESTVAITVAIAVK